MQEFPPPTEANFLCLKLCIENLRQTCYQIKICWKSPVRYDHRQREIFFKYLYEQKPKHITLTLAKGSFIMPKFRKAGEDANFDIFSFKIDDTSVPKEIKEDN